MKNFLQLQPHPFRALLYLEWILLGITILGFLDFIFFNFFVEPAASAPHLLFPLLAIALFGIMGLRLPAGSALVKGLYITVELALIGGVAIAYDPWSIDVLMLVVVIRTCLILERAGQLTVAIAVCALFLIRQWDEVAFLLEWQFDPYRGWIVRPSPDLEMLSPQQPPEILWQLFFLEPLFYILLLAFVLISVNALIAERRSRRQLLRARNQLRAYALCIEDQATLQERNRIAREIHDSLGHLLTAQSIQLENALLFLPSNRDKSQSFLRDGKQLGADALKELRRSVSLLRADPLQGQTLTTAIAERIAHFQQTTGIHPFCQFELPSPIPPEMRSAIYRIVQEALTNIAKYSGATVVRLKLQVLPSAKIVSLQIQDNGCGFNVAQTSAGFGLQGMRERAASLGARLEIASRPGEGCQITAQFPLRSVDSLSFMDKGAE